MLLMNWMREREEEGQGQGEREGGEIKGYLFGP